MVKCAFKKMLPIGELKVNPRNRNKHPETQIKQLAKIIEFQGWRHPIIISNLTGFVVAGHGRLEAAKLLGLAEVPVDYQDFTDADQEYLFVQSDNAIALQAELDLSGINADLGGLGPFDLELLGIKNFFVDVSEMVLDEMAEEQDGDKKYVIEVQFPNDMEMNDIKDDLINRGFIVRVK